MFENSDFISNFISNFYNIAGSVEFTGTRVVASILISEIGIIGSIRHEVLGVRCFR